MLQITKRCQMFSPGEDFPLSLLSFDDKLKIKSIWARNSSGTSPVEWRPSSIFPPFNTLKSNISYMMESRLLPDNTFAQYELPIDPSGSPIQDDHIIAPFQFFAYQGENSFSLSGFSSEVKSRINAIYAEGATATANFSVWRPSNSLNLFRSFVPGGIYLIESVGVGFADYYMGVPDPLETLSFIGDALLPDIGLIPKEYVEV